MGLSIKGISHAYGDTDVFVDLSISVAKSEIVCLLGPSGCGKTTLLRLAAGLEILQAGYIYISDTPVADSSSQIPPEQRGVGLMFQDFALFPHLDVVGNIEFGLNQMTASARKQRAREVLEQVNMNDYKHAYPHTLSGGQQQRVALARALAPKPEIILLDEPFSGLDQDMRLQIREETLGVLKSSGAATLMVTHDSDEAMFMADRILVMGPMGTILQEGKPNDIYNFPAHPSVVSLFGPTNRLIGVAHNEKVSTPLGVLPAPGHDDGCKLEIIIRPYGIKLFEDGDEGILVEIVSARLVGRNTILRIRVNVQNSGYQEFLSQQRGVFPKKSSSQIRAIIQQEAAFVYRID